MEPEDFPMFDFFCRLRSVLRQCASSHGNPRASTPSISFAMTNDPIRFAPVPLRPQLARRIDAQAGIAFLNHGSVGAVPKSSFRRTNQLRRLIEAEPIELLARLNAALIDEESVPNRPARGMKPADFGFCHQRN